MTTYFSNKHWDNELAKLEWSENSRSLFKYVMKPFDDSLPSVVGDAVGTSFTEYVKNRKTNPEDK